MGTIRRHAIAVLLSIVLPLALFVPQLDSEDVFRHPVSLLAVLAIAALPHWVSWWFAARLDELRAPGFVGGLVSANAVLAFFLYGFGHHGAGLLWLFYWPLCIAGIWAGNSIGERIYDRIPPERPRNPV